MYRESAGKRALPVRGILVRSPSVVRCADGVHGCPCASGREPATRILTDDQAADYGPWFDNHRRLRELITELEALSLAIADADPRWNR
jgi:hypothetical protein